MEAYKRLADIYDEYWGKFSLRYASFIRDMMSSCLFQQREVLDLACGTGELLSLIADEWADCTGLDASEDMLRIAGAKLENRENVTLVKGDFTCFNLSKQFDLVLCCFDSLNYAKSLEGVRACFENVTRHLRSDGMFVFDIVNERHCKHLHGVSGKHELAGVKYQTQTLYDSQIQTLFTYFKFENGDEEIHRQIPIEYSQVQKLMKEGGLDILSAFSNLKQDPVDEQTSRFFIVAKVSN